MGIPQGSGLGQLLFSAHFNDLPERCPAAGCKMYAHDAYLVKYIVNT